ncbi:hypothetical protein Ddc_06336 [Ditylenchus destructor]|nr:hypothetical protein Ddc_06336 [Ditylenchus destructor]
MKRRGEFACAMAFVLIKGLLALTENGNGNETSGAAVNVADKHRAEGWMRKEAIVEASGYSSGTPAQSAGCANNKSSPSYGSCPGHRQNKMHEANYDGLATSPPSQLPSSPDAKQPPHSQPSAIILQPQPPSISAPQPLQPAAQPPAQPQYQRSPLPQMQSVAHIQPIYNQASASYQTPPHQSLTPIVRPALQSYQSQLAYYPQTHTYSQQAAPQCCQPVSQSTLQQANHQPTFQPRAPYQPQQFQQQEQPISYQNQASLFHTYQIATPTQHSASPPMQTGNLISYKTSSQPAVVPQSQFAAEHPAAKGGYDVPRSSHVPVKPVKYDNQVSDHYLVL